MKTLVNFVLFFCTFALLTMWRVDWWKGAETLHWLNEAHDEVGRRPISETETTAQVATMLEDGIPTVISHLKSICLTCGVGVTPEQQDLAFLGLDAFVCSDFDSLPGKTTYPRRDCPEVDASWAARPTSDSAPCCGNATLVTASIAMMVEALVYKTTTMPLDTLLSGGSDPSFSSTEFFVTHYIDLYSFIMQLVVSQRGRMAAVQYHARWVDREDAPGRVKPSATFWSFNYQPNSTMELLRLGMLFLGLLTVLHDRRAVLRAFRYGTLSHALAELDKTLSNTYVTAIEVPSTLLPVALEIFRPFLPLPTWTFWVTASQMLMVVRLFSDATVIPPFRRIVEVFQEALPNIVIYVLSLAPISVLTAVMDGQLFGIFDAGYADPAIAVSRVLRILTAPPPAETVESATYGATAGASLLLYYWSTFVLRLAFGSFIVAILVGAFNKVAARDEERARRRTNNGLPPGYVDANEGSPLASGCTVLVYTLTSRAYGEWGADLVAALEREEASRGEAEVLVWDIDGDGDVSADEGEVMVQPYELVALLGARPARKLLHAFGVRGPPPGMASMTEGVDDHRGASVHSGGGGGGGTMPLLPSAYKRSGEPDDANPYASASDAVRAHPEDACSYGAAWSARGEASSRRTLGDAPMPYAQRVRELYQAQQRVAERAGAARELVTIRHHSNQPAPASPTRGEVVA